MPKKPGLTHDEHLRLGQVLAGIRDQLQHERVTLLGAYPKSGPVSLPAQRLQAAIKAVDEARYALENTNFTENPEQASTSDYFPNPQNRAGIAVPPLPGREPPEAQP
ncbi:hypothetical protein ACWCYY_34780 [Kitasatospora sp. NPDC001664]